MSPRSLLIGAFSVSASSSPFVVLPDTTGAEWWFNKPDNDEHSKPDFIQVLFMKELKYRKAMPPSYAGSKQN